MAKQRSGGATTPRGREMREILREWRASGQSLEQFAKEHGISRHTLSWWRWKLGESGKGRTRRAKPKFVEVKAPAAQPMVVAALEVRLPNGAEIRVPASVGGEKLEELVRAIARC